MRTKNGFKGIEAVIDKDFATQLLANSLGIKTMVILTDVDLYSLTFAKKSAKT